MKATSRPAALLCLFACLGTTLAIPLAAQTPAPDANKERVIPQLEFHHTQIRDLVEYLRQQVPEANIVIQTGAGDVRVSELKLRNVTLTQALLALPFATGHEVNVNPPNPAAPDLFTIVDVRKGASQNVKPEIITEVFLLPPWPDGSFDQQLAAALDGVHHLYALARDARKAAGERDEDLHPPMLEMHRPTRILLAAGTHESVELVRQIILTLSQKPGAFNPGPATDNGMKVMILGQVQKPGLYPLEGGTLAQLIARAGGVTSTANPKRISVNSKDGKNTDVDLSSAADAKIREGDTVTVP